MEVKTTNSYSCMECGKYDQLNGDFTYISPKCNYILVLCNKCFDTMVERVNDMRINK